MFSSCRAARVFTADEAPADRIITHPDIQATSLRIRCNSHDLSHLGICERDTINRSALVVEPAQLFLDWLHRVDPTSTHLTLDDLRLEPTIYLLPHWDTEDEALQLLAEVSNEIFEEQLNGCYRVPPVWPATRDPKRFLLCSTAASIQWSYMFPTNTCATRTCDGEGLQM
jgi:hypothetical protein